MGEFRTIKGRRSLNFLFVDDPLGGGRRFLRSHLRLVVRQASSRASLCTFSTAEPDVYPYHRHRRRLAGFRHRSQTMKWVHEALEEQSIQLFSLNIDPSLPQVALQRGTPLGSTSSACPRCLSVVETHAFPPHRAGLEGVDTQDEPSAVLQWQTRQPCSAQVPHDRWTCRRRALRARCTRTAAFSAVIPAR